jgi:branched-subunit amino acid ABC-type transport system permease component
VTGNQRGEGDLEVLAIYVIVIAVLLLRPAGLFGKAAA